MNKIRSLFNDASKNNPTMLGMYYLAYPLVLLFEKIKFTPNMVTLLSLLFSFVSIFFLLEKNSLYYFMIFFFLSQLLDYADGTLARKTKQINIKKLDLDHLSDIIKILLTKFALAFFFQNIIIWILVFISSVCFLYFSWLHDAKKKTNSKKENQSIKKTSLIRDKYLWTYFIYNIPFLGEILKFCYRFCTTLQGQSVLIFIIAPINKHYCMGVLFYFIFVVNINLLKHLVHPKSM
tara:strand:+ start:3785 stop:4489 length:705 start_codon:yes stop_codon:yes gene_type:complete